MTRDEGQRLAVVETQVTAIREDLTEVKADVKKLVARDSGWTALVGMFGGIVPWLALVLAAASMVAR